MFVNTHNLPGDKLSDILRLQHSISPIDELGKTGWERRAAKLKEYAASEAWIWTAQNGGAISHDRLLTWMKAPHPKELVRYFKVWGLNDIFVSITQKETARERLWLGVQGLVDLRNNIAHGDYTVQATQADIRRYMGHVKEFCRRVDRRISTAIARQFTIAPPW